MTSENIDKQIQLFLEKNIGSLSKIEKLTGDASTREYSRVYTSNKTYILCFDSQFAGNRLNNYPFWIIHQILDSININVPSIYATDNKLGLLLLHDLGDDHLEDIYCSLSEKQILNVYLKVIETLIKIQTIKKGESLPFNLSFDADKLMFEFDFFIENALKGYFRSPINQTEIDELRKEFFRNEPQEAKLDSPSQEPSEASEPEKEAAAGA